MITPMEMPTLMVDEKWLDNLLKDYLVWLEYGTDSPYVAPNEKFKQAILKRIEQEKKLAELYGRLHETIENFQHGKIASNTYSQRHAELTEQISQLKEVNKSDCTCCKECLSQGFHHNSCPAHSCTCRYSGGERLQNDMCRVHGVKRMNTPNNSYTVREILNELYHSQPPFTSDDPNEMADWQETQVDQAEAQLNSLIQEAEEKGFKRGFYCGQGMAGVELDACHGNWKELQGGKDV